ncbi:hypothetical protein Sste5346_006557 [Sporothrix stenoceras]|uniref:Xylanolytic transcriptional activator regulatory domain-containing protein n=1 Tax=Sporothrix stenoceras TaxID=5173 RepID=A0ABR3YXK7_9PEZI
MAGHKHRLSRAGRDVDANPDVEPVERPGKKPRKQRPCFSCEGGTDSPTSTPVRSARPARSHPTQEGTPQPAEPSVNGDSLNIDAGTSNSAPAFLDFQNAVLGRPAEPQAQAQAQAPAQAQAQAPRTTASPQSRVDQQQATAGHTNINVDETVDDEEKSNSYGTLVMSRGGRSKYLGPTAGSEWLKDSQLHDTTTTPSITRCPSPDVDIDEVHHEQLQPPIPQPLNTSPIAFPINATAAQIRTRDLLAHLPPADEAWALIESYYRYCAWHHDVAPKPRFQETFARVYSFVTPGTAPPTSAINFQEVALVFMMMSKGTVYNIEMPTDDPSAEEWQHLSEMALVKGNFLSNNTIAGHIMAHKNFQSDKGRHDDKAWLLWGLAMRMIQAMGLHRDGARWNLPPDIVEERRKVFWEVNAADIFQAHCFSRPSTVNPDHCDTEFPSEPRFVSSEKGYFELRFELSQISFEILNMAMKARRPHYSEVTMLDQKLRKYEQNLPYYIRCRAALVAMVSRYPSPEEAIAVTPEPARRNMPLSFQQSNLCLNLCETVINLHRPYYAKALYDDTDASNATDTHASIYAPSFYCVIERCAMILAIVSDIHARYPAISTRQWNFWYHVFGSALCLGTLVLKHPTHAMAHFVLLQIDTSIALFSSLVQNGANTPRYQRNLQWLQKLRSRAAAKMAKAQQQTANQDRNMDDQIAIQRDHPVPAMAPTNGQDDRDKDVDLIGWRTRLIRQADQQQTVVNNNGNGIMNGFNMSNNTSNNNSALDTGTATSNTTPKAISGDIAMMPGQMTLQSTDDVLREFWDPIMLQDLLEGPIDPNDQHLTSLMNSGPSWWEWEYGPSAPRTSMEMPQ